MSIQTPWQAHCDPSLYMTASTQNSWLAHSGAPEQMLSHLLLCVLGCADDLPLHCSVNTLPTLRTRFCFPSSLRKIKKMLYTSSCQLLAFASRHNLADKIHNGLNKQKVAFLLSASYSETALKASPTWGITLYASLYRDPIFKSYEEKQGS